MSVDKLGVQRGANKQLVTIVCDLHCNVTSRQPFILAVLLKHEAKPGPGFSSPYSPVYFTGLCSVLPVLAFSLSFLGK